MESHNSQHNFTFRRHYSTNSTKKRGTLLFILVEYPIVLLTIPLFVPSFALLTAFAVPAHSAYAEQQGSGGSSKISPLNTRKGTALLFLFLCLSEILFVPIMIYGLYVVIFVKKIKNTIHLLNIFFACQFYISLRNHCYFCRCHHYLFIL